MSLGSASTYTTASHPGHGPIAAASAGSADSRRVAGSSHSVNRARNDSVADTVELEARRTAGPSLGNADGAAPPRTPCPSLIFDPNRVYTATTPSPASTC